MKMNIKVALRSEMCLNGLRGNQFAFKFANFMKK